MRLKPIVLSMAVSLATLAAGNAHAFAAASKPSALPASLALDLAPTVITDTATDLKVQWTWDLLNASSTLNLFSTPKLVNWNVSLASYTKSVSVPDLGSFAMLAATLDAQHVSAPHSGDAGTGDAFHYVWVQSNVSSFSGSTTSLLAHAGAHSDTYTFDAVRTGGDVQFTLTAVHAVPEPETYAMLLAGLGLVGAAARRRRMH